ncbi:MAG: GGDEF domain-containing protein [Pseudomonadota bacterium]
MDRLMRLLAPKGWIGFAVRLIVLVGSVTAANIVFARFFDPFGAYSAQAPTYYLYHAIIVGGPFIAFFLAVAFYQVRLQRKLWQLSHKDGLTGLNNRRRFFALMERANTTGQAGVLLMLDADRFKSINDTHGHQAGDICLKSIAHTLQRSLRQNDIIGRIGGEEFAVYLPGVGMETGRVIGERLTKPIPFRTKGDQCVSVTLSIGAATWQHDISIDAVFARADAALYHAKENGRGRLEVWNPPLLTKEDETSDKLVSFG